MQKNFVYKFITIASLCGLFLFGLMFISGLVNERQAYYHTVMNDIKKTHVNDQAIATPFMVIANAQGVYVPVFPAKSDINTQAKVSNSDYQRSIYHAISYQTGVAVKQEFDLKPTLTQLAPVITATDKGYNVIPSEPIVPIEGKTSTTVTQSPQTADTPKTPPMPRTYQWQTAKLIIPVSDLRGVTLPTVVINDKNFTAQFAKQPTVNGMTYIEVNLGDWLKDDATRQLLLTSPVKLQLTMNIAGIDSFNVLPLGEQFGYALQANWTEPKFFGDALPTKQFSPAGFSAAWQNPFLANHNNQQITDCLYSSRKNNCGLFTDFSATNPTESVERGSEMTTGEQNYKWLSTAFVDSNNTYTLTDRTLKYALLLILVSFGTFFLFEVLKNLRIHPIQYGLVATALLVFYVLLLSFAEHIPFWQAYVVASVACVGLIGWYASFVLHSVLRSLGFSTILGGLYAGFYLILASEGMNLLLGAVFCFALLAIVMFLTRKIDWYNIGEYRGKTEAPSQRVAIDGLN